jgi:hypothetical protein
MANALMSFEEPTGCDEQRIRDESARPVRG